MENEFVSYEIALALKELGFESPYPIGGYQGGKVFYYENGELYYDGRPMYSSDYHSGQILAPLYQQAFRWFRKVHRIEGWVQPYLSPEPRRCEAKYWDGGRTPSTGTSIGIYDTYKEAELECLIKLISILKEKS